MRQIIAVDPGREKTGMARVNEDGTCHTMTIVPTPDVLGTIQEWMNTSPVTAVVCGNGTNHKAVFQVLKQGLPDTVSLSLINESYSTEEARKRFWDLYPPTGLQRLIPKGMRTIPRPVDDITAWIIGERYVHQQLREKGEL